MDEMAVGDWSWADNVPQWEVPDELMTPTESPDINLAIKLLSNEDRLGNDVIALVGRFVAEYADFNVWFGEVGSLQAQGDQLTHIFTVGKMSTKRVYDTWLAYDRALGPERKGEAKAEYGVLVSALHNAISDLRAAQQTNHESE